MMKYIYIVFVIILTVYYYFTGNFEIFSAYLIMGGITFIATLLHMMMMKQVEILTKLDSIEEKND